MLASSALVSNGFASGVSAAPGEEEVGAGSALRFSLLPFLRRGEVVLKVRWDVDVRVRGGWE